MKLSSALCYLMILITHARALPRLYLGSNCDFHGAPALCKTLDECPPALASVLKTHEHNFTRCGFTNDDIEIVCCPDLRVRMTPSPMKESKSVMACRQIYEGAIQKVESTVINGDDADDNEFPHMAALAFNRSNTITYECGGSLISDRFVLTAAHCFIHSVVPSKVRLGVTRLSDSEHLDVDIKNHTLHPLYTTRTRYHDIALIELAENVNFSDRVRPACLYEHPDDPQGVQVIGWGQTLNDSNSDVLQKASLGIVSPQLCDEFVRRSSLGTNALNSTHQLCAIGKDADSCNGDSGGPLHLEREEGGYEIVGIVSHGTESCSAKMPNSIYTRVSFYVEWIEDIVWGDNI